MPTTDEEALLAQVLAAPDDDAPRLVYADFLTAQGDPRGEFISLQCRLAAAPDDEARRVLRIAENKLLAAHSERWSEGLRRVVPGASIKIEFRRGFLEVVTLPLHALDDLAPLFREAPLLRRLRVDAPPFLGQTLTPPSLAGRLSSPLLRRVGELELRLAALGNAGAIELGLSAQLAGLRSLQLQASAWPMPMMERTVPVYAGPPASHLLDDAGAIALARSPHLTQLRHLDLAGNSVGVEGVRALLDAGWPLEHLDLSGNAPLDEAVVHALAEAGSLAGLRTLRLSGLQLRPATIEALARSKQLGSLESLRLTSCQLGPSGLKRFLAALRLPKLTALSLEYNELGDEGALALAMAPVSTQLTSLELGYNHITQKGVAALADSAHLGNLERLLFHDPYLKKKAVVEHLVASPTLARCRIYVKGLLLGRAKAAKAKTPRKKRS